MMILWLNSLKNIMKMLYMVRGGNMADYFPWGTDNKSIMIYSFIISTEGK